MAEYDSRDRKQKTREESRKRLKETVWRLTAPVHVTLNSYKEHERIEGYYEFKDYRHVFQCDRLLKLETVYGRVQMGYNPNRRRSFLFANMKTNLYDTVSFGYQKSMKEYQRRPEQKRGGKNMAYVSGRKKNAAVLLEKTESRPWSEGVLRPYFHNANLEVILKTMPFFHAEAEREQLQQVRERMRLLQEQVRDNARKGEYERNRGLQQRLRELGEESELLQSILRRKDAGRRGFIRKINYAFDIEKHQMFQYYREQRLKSSREQISAIDQQADEEGNSSENKEQSDQNE
ncbi:MAG: hypothetical protein ACI4D5_06320 [Kineothrix sp.]